MSVLYVFRIPLAIVGIALLVGIFSKQAMGCILFFGFGVVVMAIPAVFTGKTLVKNIIIIQKGEKFSGTCTGYKLERWNCGHDVCWVDENNIKLHRRFDVPMIKFKYPCQVNVYSLNHSVNLGIFTVIKDILCFVACLVLWVFCVIITTGTIYNILFV
ncbi:MAG: hypothetical protein K2I06_04465 [Ruminococcus sp.]|nr:hypothetical protein [Ruminococcus sp.]